jgi:SPP1 family predicted phage head-tail adaptor
MRSKIQAGKYRYPAQIQQRQMAQDQYGESINDWATVLNVRVGVSPSTGTERFLEHEEFNQISHRVYMRYVRNVVTPDMRILYDGRTFLIEAVIDYQERHQELQLMCRELIENE